MIEIYWTYGRKGNFIMGYESSNRRKKIVIAVLCALVPLVLYLFVAIIYSCIILNTPSPSEIALEWVCEEPSIQVYHPTIGQTNAVLHKDSQSFDAFLGVQGGFYDMLLKNPDGSWETVFSGEYYFTRKNDKMILLVDDDDSFYGGKYKKLVFTPVPGTEVTTK